jgi:hypothetical protein
MLKFRFNIFGHKAICSKVALIMLEKLAQGGTGVFKKLEPKTYNAYEEDIAVVQVFFEPSAVFLYGSESSQTWVDFFATVGGLLGLCIGVSIISIVEIFWLCLKLVVKAMKLQRTYRRGRKPLSQSGKKMSTSTF